MNFDPYQSLARRLDALPNGFPATADGLELRLLRKLFTPEEALLASYLNRKLETAEQIALRIGGDQPDPKELNMQLKKMVRKGLIAAGPVEGGLGYGLMPFVVGIYEMQNETIDAELAELFEQYYLQAFGKMLAQSPSVHRIIPVDQSIPNSIEVRPFESATGIIESCSSWGVVECICRKQKRLVGDPCNHPLDNCMVLSTTPGAFDQSKSVRALSKQEALDTLRQAAEAGLVHSVSNHRQEIWYICNCCTCSCGVLRGMVDLGIANVVARSAYISQVDPECCQLCGTCLDRCQFSALTLDDVLLIDERRCVGCGLCVLTCPEEALQLILRPEEEILVIPETSEEWMAVRARERGIDLVV
jgi:Na+-translocating ferredoxin:NAD+ oxidoreductase subunit B